MICHYFAHLWWALLWQPNMAQNHKVILTPPKTSFCLGRYDCRNVHLYLLTCKVIDELDLRKMFSRNCYDKLLYFEQEDVFYSSDILQMFEFGIESNIDQWLCTTDYVICKAL